MKEMKIIASLDDDRYPYTGITHTRSVARAILADGQNRICLMHVKCTDMFGKRDYYETPGGGVEDGESLEDAVLREIAEETGCKAEILAPIGCVSDYYNLIGRHNLNNYFLLRKTGSCERRLDEYENGLFSGCRWFTPEEAVAAYGKMCIEPLESLVRARELPVLLKALEILENIGASCDDSAVGER